MIKEKLSLDEQIAHMKTKGIQFNITTEEQARDFLTKSNYYFKLKAYAKNFDKYQHGEKKGNYINLEFAYLKELSTLDMHFRHLIIEMCLTLEHALKIRLLNDCGKQEQEDGYQIIAAFYTRYPEIQSEIKRKATASVCHDLITKHIDTFALWNIVEILSFGEFINLYQLYYEKYEDKSSFSKAIFPIKLLRNAAAHNNCLLNSLAKPYSIEIKANEKLTRVVSRISNIGKRELRNKMSNPVIHDFVLLLYLFDRIVESEDARTKTYEKLKHFINERVPQHKEYFSKNQILVTSYQFVKKTVDSFTESRVSQVLQQVERKRGRTP